MIQKTALLLYLWLPWAVATAAPIRFEQLPASTTSYFHFDVGRFQQSQLFKSMVATKQLDDPTQFDIFGPHADITIFTLRLRTGAGSALFLHTSDAGFRRRLEANIARASDSLVVSYANQEIHYSAGSVNSMLLGIEVKPEPDAHPKQKSETRTMSFNLGLSDEGQSAFLFSGPTYSAFVGNDLVVMTSDLPSMALVLDTMHGQKPSLAKEDPHGLRFEAPSGAYALGAGLTADLRHDDAGTSRPASAESVKSSPFGFGMFESFSVRTRVAHFDVGEDDVREFADGIFVMKDADSAVQLRNLVVGIKALISLTKADYKPLINPLTVEADQTHATLHWEWPSANLADLFRVTDALNGGPAKPVAAAHSTTRPAH